MAKAILAMTRKEIVLIRIYGNTESEYAEKGSVVESLQIF
jgi:hypothetical protein